MKKISITFTDDQIALIRNLRFQKVDMHEKMQITPGYTDYVKILKRDEEGKDRAEEVMVGDLIESRHLYLENIYGLDSYCFWGGSPIEDVAMILGIRDRAIPGSDESPFGPSFNEEDDARIRGLIEFFDENIEHIMEIVIQMCTEGVRAGVEYWCLPHEHIWHAKEKE